MQKISFFIILALLCCSCKQSRPPALEPDTITKLPYFNCSDFTPEWGKGTHKIPPFSFTNQLGETVTNETYKGKIYIADFFFTICPGICPKLTENMASLQKKYAKEKNIKLLSHSVMPWHDSVAVLAAYAKKNKVKAKMWNLVTGDKDAIYNIARNGYFADEDFGKTQAENDFIHTENFILVDKEGYIRGVYNGTIAIDMQRLDRHINVLKNEK
ncbi:SCO family protein [uncultured Maribacter sp.]|uniref:SCO family protein n=1 Tax=uncultured Maribacter sp. TaxID=431308 RepID=UPI002607BF33|nr:SCO family protein [uncultured Maribacter sp.]